MENVMFFFFAWMVLAAPCPPWRWSLPENAAPAKVLKLRIRSRAVRPWNSVNAGMGLTPASRLDSNYSLEFWIWNSCNLLFRGESSRRPARNRTRCRLPMTTLVQLSSEVLGLIRHWPPWRIRPRPSQLCCHRHLVGGCQLRATPTPTLISVSIAPLCLEYILSFVLLASLLKFFSVCFSLSLCCQLNACLSMPLFVVSINRN